MSNKDLNTFQQHLSETRYLLVIVDYAGDIDVTEHSSVDGALQWAGREFDKLYDPSESDESAANMNAMEMRFKIVELPASQRWWKASDASLEYFKNTLNL